MKQIKPLVFWPPFLLLLGAVAYSLLRPREFIALMEVANGLIIAKFGWLFNAGTFFMLLVAIALWFSPLAGIRIGGRDARPLLTRWRWFSITLCTTIAVGVLFWGTAEPLFHYYEPPQSLGIEPASYQSARFALSTVFLHWTYTPYAIYTVPAVGFALVYYNMKKPYSLCSLLTPLLGDRILGRPGQLVDAICLFSLVTGMAASLGTGLLTLAGGLDRLVGLEVTPLSLAVITVTIVAAFAASAASGLMKGIRILSDINLRIFLALAGFVLIFGPTSFILSFGTEVFGDFLVNLPKRSLFNGTSGDPWPAQWTIFYWTNWLAWAPVTALFLGRIGYGYTVREFISMNLFLPATFVAGWMMIFSGTALHMELIQQTGMQAMIPDDSEKIIYKLFGTLPLAGVIVALFVATAFLSYVTSADSNTAAMGGISSAGISPESPEPSVFAKLAWGLTVGVIAWVMVSYAGLDGVKAISKLGGFPALLLALAITAAIIRVALNPRRYLNVDADSARPGTSKP